MNKATISELKISRERILNMLTIENNAKARGMMQARVLEINAKLEQLTK